MKSHSSDHTDSLGRWIVDAVVPFSCPSLLDDVVRLSFFRSLPLSPSSLIEMERILHDSLCIWAARGYDERRSTFNLPSTSNLTMQDFVRIWGFSPVQWGKVDLKICQKTNICSFYEKPVIPRLLGFICTRKEGFWWELYLANHVFCWIIHLVQLWVLQTLFSVKNILCGQLYSIGWSVLEEYTISVTTSCIFLQE